MNVIKMYGNHDKNPLFRHLWIFQKINVEEGDTNFLIFALSFKDAISHMPKLITAYPNELMDLNQKDMFQIYRITLKELARIPIPKFIKQSKDFENVKELAMSRILNDKSRGLIVMWRGKIRRSQG